jgi:hypothetical protein
LRDIFDNDALTAFQCRPASRIVMINEIEEIWEWRFESVLLHDPQDGALKELDISLAARVISIRFQNFPIGSSL